MVLNKRMLRKALESISGEHTLQEDTAVARLPGQLIASGTGGVWGTLTWQSLKSSCRNGSKPFRPGHQANRSSVWATGGKIDPDAITMGEQAGVAYVPYDESFRKPGTA